MATISNQDALLDRAQLLEDANLNGIARVLVAIPAAAIPPNAQLSVHLFNTLHRDLLVAAASSPSAARQLFPLSGGMRLRAGSATGQVQVQAVVAGSEPHELILTVLPIGDYSTYTLTIDDHRLDPVFASIDFKFRPGCFSNNCSPEWQPGAAPEDSPHIDYLAKDYASFRHVMISGMMDRIPDWQATSEADLDQVLIDLFAAAGDELSDYQDRVMAESKFATARSRISIARHARLMDYHIHQGNQSSTWVVLDIDAAGEIAVAAEQIFWTGEQAVAGIDHVLDQAIYFASKQPARLHPLFNTLQLYTWDDAYPALAAGATSADLAVDPTGTGMSEAVAAQFLVDCIRATNPTFPPLRQLVIQETLNPQTGTANGIDSSHRQLLRLLEGSAGAELIQDPLNARTLVRVYWQPADALHCDYYFTVFPAGARVTGAAALHGNLIEAFAGQPVTSVFVEAGESQDPADSAAVLDPGEVLHGRHINTFQRSADHRYGVLAELSHRALLYQPTPPGGEIPPRSTLRVTVHTPGGGSDLWDEVISLVHSDDSAENGDHFAVETDAHGRSLLRFGNGINGRLLPERSIIVCRYQVGVPHAGNIGRDVLRNAAFDGHPAALIRRCWNPFDVSNAREPEPVSEILRTAPAAFRARQLRAITTEDYVARAEQVDGVQRAHAVYRWTGSWRTVRITIDPVGSTAISPDLRRRVSDHLEAVRLIGEDLELRAPRYVPIAILVAVCIHPDMWPEDLRHVLEQECSDRFTPDGRPGFFHPDGWTFGQQLRKSELAGRIIQVPGVDHIRGIYWTRFNEPTPGVYDLSTAGPEQIFVGDDEIIMVENDPDYMEKGFIRFFLSGGRR